LSEFLSKFWVGAVESRGNPALLVAQVDGEGLIVLNFKLTMMFPEKKISGEEWARLLPCCQPGKAKRGWDTSGQSQEETLEGSNKPGVKFVHHLF
jgi:hypothetical protein